MTQLDIWLLISAASWAAVVRRFTPAHHVLQLKTANDWSPSVREWFRQWDNSTRFCHRVTVTSSPSQSYCHNFTVTMSWKKKEYCISATLSHSSHLEPWNCTLSVTKTASKSQSLHYKMQLQCHGVTDVTWQLTISISQSETAFSSLFTFLVILRRGDRVLDGMLILWMSDMMGMTESASGDDGYNRIIHGSVESCSRMRSYNGTHSGSRNYIRWRS